MANPKAMYDATAKEFELRVNGHGIYGEVLSACIIACAIKESKDEIVQALDRLTKAAGGE